MAGILMFDKWKYMLRFRITLLITALKCLYIRSLMISHFLRWISFGDIHIPLCVKSTNLCARCITKASLNERKHLETFWFWTIDRSPCDSVADQFYTTGFFLDFLGFLEWLFDLHMGHMGALRWMSFAHVGHFCRSKILLADSQLELDTTILAEDWIRLLC